MDEKAVTEILARDPWFAGLSPALARDVVRLARVRRVNSAMLFAVGDEPNGLFGVLAGEVRLSHSESNGRIGLLLVCRAGSWFGETSLFDGRPRFLDAFAVGPCDLLYLSASAFQQLTRESSSNYQAFVRLQCDHYRLALNHIVSFGELPVFLRVVQRLLFFSLGQNESGEPTNVVQLSQEDFASMVGISRQALNVHLKDLERKGIISLGYGTIKLNRRDMLEELMLQGP